MDPTPVSRHASSKSRWQTAVCLALILAAALVIARSLKFTTQVDCTLPAVLLDESRETGVPTTMRIQGELVRQRGRATASPAPWSWRTSPPPPPVRRSMSR